MDKRWRPFSFKSPARRQSYRSDLFGADLQDQPPPPLHTGPVPPTEARMHITLNQQPQPVPPGWEDEPLLWLLREPLGLTGTPFGRRRGPMRSLPPPQRRRSAPRLPADGARAARALHHHHRGAGGARRDAAPRATGLAGPARAPVRLLPERPDHGRRGLAARHTPPQRCADRRRHVGPPVPLRHPAPRARSHPPSSRGNQTMKRRPFLAAAGAGGLTLP